MKKIRSFFVGTIATLALGGILYATSSDTATAGPNEYCRCFDNGGGAKICDYGNMISFRTKCSCDIVNELCVSD